MDHILLFIIVQYRSHLLNCLFVTRIGPKYCNRSAYVVSSLVTPASRPAQCVNQTFIVNPIRRIRQTSLPLNLVRPTLRF